VVGPPVRAFGWYMAPAGDVDGDGRDDVLIAADNAEIPKVGLAAGAFGLYPGAPRGLDLAGGTFVAGALPDERLGQDVLGLGDVSADGFADVAVGAPGSTNVGPWDQPGRVFIDLGHGDVDLDGHVSLEDRDDGDASAHPDAGEVVGDGVAQGCDGEELSWVDHDADVCHAGAVAPSPDRACDGLGEADASTPWGDCDDEDPDRGPRAPEIAGDGVDQDGDGQGLALGDDPLDAPGAEPPEDDGRAHAGGPAPLAGVGVAAWRRRRRAGATQSPSPKS
ncbi:MAG TPA: integrin alpha, partial [Myxococcota bacterium]|nr:integrin alpha [Myxococcota bacterium]